MTLYFLSGDVFRPFFNELSIASNAMHLDLSLLNKLLTNFRSTNNERDMPFCDSSPNDQVEG